MPGDIFNNIIDHFDKQRLHLVMHKIEDMKGNCYDRFVENHSFEVFRGNTYNDNKKILFILLKFIFEECDYDIEKANSYFLSLDSQQIEPYIVMSIKQAAEIDYWSVDRKDSGYND